MEADDDLVFAVLVVAIPDAEAFLQVFLELEILWALKGFTGVFDRLDPARYEGAHFLAEMIEGEGSPHRIFQQNRP